MKCAICGKETTGTVTEGGLTWAVCAECWEREYGH